MSGMGTRVAVLFALAALLPVLLTGLVWLGMSNWGNEPAADQARLAARAFEQAESHRTNALESLCRDDLVVDRLLAERAGGADERLDYDRLLGASMQAAGFDALWVLDARSAEVAATGHGRRGAGQRDPALLGAAQTAGDAPFVWGGNGLPVVLVQTCTVERGGAVVTLVGGQSVDTLRALDPKHIVVIEEPGSDDTMIAALSDPKGTPKLFVVWRSGLAEGVPPLLLWLGSVALLTLGLAFFLGEYFNRWLQGSVDELAEAATRIGAGDLSATVLSTRSDAFQATATAFNRMTKDLRKTQEQLKQTERIAAWQDIARRLAHELKNPLSPIRLSIETLRKAHERSHDDFEALFDESTRTILQEVERLRHIIDEFSRFARLPTPTLRETDLREIVPQAVSLYASDDAIDVQTQLPGHPVRARVDVEQITQVLHNLVQNARDAALVANPNAGGRVRVRLERDRAEIQIRVEDNGLGIPAERIDEIFDPYVTDKVGGTGLGLSISSRIVSEHGGRIEVESRPGRTAFIVILPSSTGATGS